MIPGKDHYISELLTHKKAAFRITQRTQGKVGANTLGPGSAAAVAREVNNSHLPTGSLYT